MWGSEPRMFQQVGLCSSPKSLGVEVSFCFCNSTTLTALWLGHEFGVSSIQRWFQSLYDGLVCSKSVSLITAQAAWVRPTQAQT